ncbi:MAG: glutathione S-transferase family protein [Alphaproteobacteria bacterium]
MGAMLTLYDALGSGNGHKVRLLLRQLGRPFERVLLDIVDKRETRTPDFLAKNPNGRIPTLEFEDGRILVESNAILWFLAQGTAFVPADPFQQAQALQWMFFEQYSHEPYIAVARYIRHYQMDELDAETRLAALRPRGEAALAVMDGHLAKQDWFAGGTYSIADIALNAYTHVADEAGFDLTGYPAVRAWLARVAAQPDYEPMGDPW